MAYRDVMLGLNCFFRAHGFPSLFESWQVIKESDCTRRKSIHGWIGWALYSVPCFCAPYVNKKWVGESRPGAYEFVSRLWFRRNYKQVNKWEIGRDCRRGAALSCQDNLKIETTVKYPAVFSATIYNLIYVDDGMGFFSIAWTVTSYYFFNEQRVQ